MKKKKSFTIDWEKLSQEEAEAILEGIISSFNAIAKSATDNKFHDISYIKLLGVYDDEFHAQEVQI